MDNALQTTNTGPMPGDAAVEPLVDLSGQAMGDFQLLRRLGQGGMGQVYLAEQLSLKRKVALKIMRADLAANPTALKRFDAEAKAVARVTHADIVQVYAVGMEAGLHFMALEYVEGRTLREFIAKRGPPELPVALSIMRQAAAALVEAHEAGIIHRDIKPENILLTRKGEVKVADFGLSRCFGGDGQALNVTQSGVSMGTPLYMSPEQVQGHAVDPRTDIYSLGVTSYHMLTGQPPFRGQTAFEVAVQHVQNQPAALSETRPDLPVELCQLVHKMMAKEPAQRHQSSQDLLADVMRLSDSLSGVRSQTNPPLSFGEGVPPVAATTLFVPRDPALGRRRGRRLRIAAAVAFSLVLAGIGGAGLRIWNTPDSGKLARDTRLSPTGEAVRMTGAGKEAALLAAYKKEVNVLNPDDFRKQLDATIQLGVFYLDQRRLADADKFFGEISGKLPVHSAWGRLGQAAVLAFQNKPEESNKLFSGELEKARGPIGDKGGKGFEARPFGKHAPVEMMLALPVVRRVVAEALDHNAANLGDAFPQELEKYRKVPLGPSGKPNFK